MTDLKAKMREFIIWNSPRNFNHPLRYGTFDELILREVVAPVKNVDAHAKHQAMIRFDPDILDHWWFTIVEAPLTQQQLDDLPLHNYLSCHAYFRRGNDPLVQQVRRLTYRNGADMALRLIFVRETSFPSLDGRMILLDYMRRNPFED
jgi:hypothetical protein